MSQILVKKIEVIECDTCPTLKIDIENCKEQLSQCHDSYNVYSINSSDQRHNVKTQCLNH